MAASLLTNHVNLIDITVRDLISEEGIARPRLRRGSLACCGAVSRDRGGCRRPVLVMSEEGKDAAVNQGESDGPLSPAHSRTIVAPVNRSR